MPQTEVWTVGRLLQWTADFLKKQGSDSPRLDAEVLLAHALDCQRIELYTAFEQVAAEGPRTQFRELVRQRAEGKPVAYLVGHREFYSLSFRVTPDVLIPRPETELVVVKLLELACERPKPEPLRIADIGTGSGILAVCAAKHLSTCRVTAVDISAPALEIARENAAAHGVAERIDFIQSDLFASVPTDAQFDFVVSNPPYVAAGELDKVPAEVRNYEPRGALVAGPRGTEIIEALAPQAAERLVSGGHLIVEVSPMVNDAVRQLLAADPRWELATTTKDLARLPRVVHARRK